MKKLIVYALCVSTFFVGIGALADGVGARYRSDARALEIIAKARQAIGGEAAIREVRSLVIKGQTTTTVKFDGNERSAQGESEIALQLPDKLFRTTKIGSHDGAAGNDKHVEGQMDVVVVRKGEGGQMPLEIVGKDGTFTTPDGKTVTVVRADGAAKTIEGDGRKIIVRKMGDGQAEFKTEDADKTVADGEAKRVEIRRMAPHGMTRQNELLRTTLALLISAPEGLDVAYTFVGESTVEGTAVNIVSAAAQGSTFKLYFDRSTNLPVGMSYLGHPMPMVVKFRKDADGAEQAAGEQKDKILFNKQLEGIGEAVENFVRFSDYRNTGGVLLPYNWTTSVAGAVREVFSVASYEVNPANIAERFTEGKVMVRMPKPPEQK